MTNAERWFHGPFCGAKSRGASDTLEGSFQPLPPLAVQQSNQASGPFYAEVSLRHPRISAREIGLPSFMSLSCLDVNSSYESGAAAEFLFFPLVISWAFANKVAAADANPAP